MYWVFYHDLLIPKLLYNDYKNYINGLDGSKDMLYGYQKILLSQSNVRMK